MGIGFVLLSFVILLHVSLAHEEGRMRVFVMETMGGFVFLGLGVLFMLDPVISV